MQSQKVAKPSLQSNRPMGQSDSAEERRWGGGFRFTFDERAPRQRRRNSFQCSYNPYHKVFTSTYQEATLIQPVPCGGTPVMKPCTPCPCKGHVSRGR
jgi:hypothetical protein